MTSGPSNSLVFDLLRWEKARASLIVAIMGGGGAVVTALAVIGAVGGDHQRLQGLVLGLPMLAVGVTVLVVTLRRRLVLLVDEQGITVEQRPEGGFSVSWNELATVRIVREPQRMGRLKLWSYTLELRPSRRRFARDLEYLREGDTYRYPLGPVGPAGRKAHRALRTLRPDVVEDELGE